MTDRQWTQERWDELMRFEKLLYELQQLNTGGDFIGRIQRCIETAKALDESYFDRQRISFLSFLRNMAIEESKRQKRSEGQQ